jgi:hypothetical protein
MKGFIFAALAFLAAWLFWDPSFTDEVTLYSAQCAGSKKIYPTVYWYRSGAHDWVEKQNDSIADCKPRTLGTTTYRLNRERGEAAYKSLHNVHRVVDCAFFDNKNWECVYNGENREPFVVIDGREGRAMNVPPDSPYHSVFSVSKWQYYLIAVLELFSLPERGSSFLIPDQFDSSR